MELLKEGASISPATQTLLNCVVKLDFIHSEIYGALSLVYTDKVADGCMNDSIEDKYDVLRQAIMDITTDVISVNLTEHKQTI